MIDPDVIARLEATCMPPLLTVEGALDLAALINAGQVKAPAAFVLPIAERADPAALANQHRQRVFGQVGVALALKAPNNATGRDAAAAVRTLRTTVMTALLGWPPATGFLGLAFAKGTLAALKNGTVWWLDVYQSEWHLRP